MKVRNLLSALILMCCAAVAAPTGEQAVSAQSALESARKAAVVDGNLPAAIKQYQAIADRYAKTDRAVAAEALLRMAEAYQMLGDTHAKTTYERIVRDYADQATPVATARGRLASLSGARPPGTMSHGLLCTDCGDGDSSISRDGRWLAFTDWDNGDLAIRDMATGETRRLLVKTGTYKDSDEYAQVPVFSPDASQIAYVWDPSKDGVPPQLRVVPNRAGAKARVLIDNPEYEWLSPLAWSSDGMRLLAQLQRRDKTWQLAWVSTATGAVTIVKSLDWRLAGVQDAQLSPDGRFIAYSARPTNPVRAPSIQERAVGEWHIYVLAADGRTETEVTRTAGIDKQPMWSPDGTHLLFRSDRAGTVDLWALPIREGKAIGPPVVVRRDIGAATNLGITNAGTYHFVRVVRGLEQVFVAEIDTTGNLPAKVRIVDSFAGLNPSWSPDGKLLEFARSSPPADGLTFNLVVRNMASGEEKLISRPGLRNAPVRWLGSGTAFLQLIGNPERPGAGGYRSLHSFDLLQGTSREVLPASSRSGVAAVSPDGTTFYQFARDPQAPLTAPFTQIVAVDLATAQERPVMRLTGPADTLPLAAPGFALALSRDGKTLAVATRNQRTGDVTLSRVGTDGSQPREVYGPFKALPLNDKLAWTKDGRAMLFATNETRQWKIMRVSAEGGQPEVTGLEVRDLGPFSVSPDGSRIAYATTTASQSELWAFDVSWVWTGKR